jgi:hypothetical protein
VLIGSGKTYTLLGSMQVYTDETGRHEAVPGVIHHAVQDIDQFIKSRLNSSFTLVNMWVLLFT